MGPISALVSSGGGRGTNLSSGGGGGGRGTNLSSGEQWGGPWDQSQLANGAETSPFLAEL